MIVSQTTGNFHLRGPGRALPGNVIQMAAGTNDVFGDCESSVAVPIKEELRSVKLIC